MRVLALSLVIWTSGCFAARPDGGDPLPAVPNSSSGSTSGTTSHTATWSAATFSSNPGATTSAPQCPAAVAQPQGLPSGFIANLAAAGPSADIYALQTNPLALERLDLSTGTWSARTAPSGFTPWGMVSAQGKLFAFDGTGVDIYEPGTDRWTLGNPQPTVRNGPHAALGLDGKIYLVGYASTVNDGAGPTAWTYDPATGAWAALPDAPISGDGTDLAAGPDGKIYLVGYQAAALDLATGTWTQLADPPTPRYWVGAAIDPAGDVISAGGYLGGSSVGSVANVDAYSTGQGAWSAAAPLPIAEGEGSAVAACGAVYVFASDFTSTAIEIYDGTTWSVVR